MRNSSYKIFTRNNWLDSKDVTKAVKHKPKKGRRQDSEGKRGYFVTKIRRRFQLPENVVMDDSIIDRNKSRWQLGTWFGS